jgi:hypothetical protein
MENKETLDSNKRPSIDRFIENYKGGSLKMLVDFIDRYHQDFWFVIAKDINPLTKVTFHDTYVRDKLLENKKLNGFNNGRDTLDGVGGEKPFIVYEHPTNDLPETSVLGIDHYTKKETLETKVFTALGEVSMCWSETPTGVFDSAKAKEIGDRLMEEIKNSLHNSNSPKYQYHLQTWGGFYNKEHTHGFKSGDYIFDTLEERDAYINKLKQAEIDYPKARMLALSTSEGYNCNVRTTLHRVIEFENKEYYTTYDMGINFPYSTAQFHMEYKWYPGFNDYPLGENFPYDNPKEYQKIKIKQEWITGAFNLNKEN